ncbi:MAG TPA: hypothetical protein VK524_07945 [Polyangiaceae bacterium]|nr:hypothetical protein [Polyangiaceae bacterium]
MSAGEQEKGNGDGSSSAMLPAVPEELGLDPLLLALLRCASFLDLSADESVNAELAGEILEHVGMYVQRLPDERLDDIQDQLESLDAYGVEQGWNSEVVEFIRDFLYNCGLGEDEETEQPVGDA